MQTTPTKPFLDGLDGPGTVRNIKYREALDTWAGFTPCGLETMCGITVLVVLHPESGSIAETQDFSGDSAIDALERCLLRLSHRFPLPLACAVDRTTMPLFDEIRWTLPWCRFVIYEDGPNSQYYTGGARFSAASAKALALARNLWQDLRDIETINQQMHWLALLDDSVRSLHDVLKRRLPHGLWTELPSLGEIQAKAGRSAQ